MVQFANYGQERERIATEAELEIFDILCTLSGDEDLRLVRKSDNYVSAVLGDWDLARFKYTNRAKWINFPCIDRGSVKRRFDDVNEIRNYAALVEESVAHIRKYSE